MKEFAGYSLKAKRCGLAQPQGGLLPGEARVRLLARRRAQTGNEQSCDLDLTSCQLTMGLGQVKYCL